MLRFLWGFCVCLFVCFLFVCLFFARLFIFYPFWNVILHLSLCVCMCVCECVCVCVCVSKMSSLFCIIHFNPYKIPAHFSAAPIRAVTAVHTHTYFHIRTYTHTHTHITAYAGTQWYAKANTHTHTHTHTYIYIYIYIYIYSSNRDPPIFRSCSNLNTLFSSILFLFHFLTSRIYFLYCFFF